MDGRLHFSSRFEAALLLSSRVILDPETQCKEDEDGGLVQQRYRRECGAAWSSLGSPIRCFLIAELGLSM